MNMNMDITKILNGSGYIPSGVYTVHDVRELRDKTKIGETIRFRSDKWYPSGHNYLTTITKPKLYVGKVVAKYPHIFVMDNGKSFQWVDYLYGKQMV